MAEQIQLDTIAEGGTVTSTGGTTEELMDRLCQDDAWVASMILGGVLRDADQRLAWCAISAKLKRIR